MSPESLIQLSDSLRSLYIKTAQKLKGSDRRQFMAEVVKGWGRGGAIIAERELGWNRRTLRISIDAKVGIKIGEFDRGGKTRAKTVAYDH